VLAAVLICVLTAGVLGGSVWFAPESSPGHAFAATTVAERAPPGGALPPLPKNVTTANVTVSSSLPGYTILPVASQTVDFSLNVTNATITPQNVTLWVEVTDSVTSVVCKNISLEYLVTNVSNISNASSRFMTAAFGVNASGLAESTLLGACPGITADTADFVVSAFVRGNVKPIDGTNVSTNSNVSPLVVKGVNTTVDTTPGTALIFAEPTENLTFANSATLDTYDLSANYTGQYVGRVALTVYSATVVGGSRSVLLSANLVQVRGHEPVATWYEPHGGNYPYTLQLFTPYAVVNTSGVIAVTNASYVYYNTTNYDPRGLAGLDPAASSALLLIAGLVVGFVVMFAVARWALAPAGGAAPKQWSGSEGGPTTPAGGAQTCTFCGRSFPTPEELAAHAKSEHGVE
jgi:hypothetical protein